MIAVVVGTRPEAIKLGPVVEELLRRGHEVEVFASGQHAKMSDGGLLAPLANVQTHFFEPIAPGNLAETVGQVAPRVASWLSRLRDDGKDVAACLVHGDTATALGGALGAVTARVFLVHVEAGLRSHDLGHPWPEELIRRQIAALADLHLAPTTLAAANLRAEGVPPLSTFIVGNPGYDALRASLARLEAMPRALRVDGSFLLVTLHRREGLAKQIPRAIQVLAEAVRGHDVRVIVPLHPTSRALFEAVVDHEGRWRLGGAMGPDEFVAHLASEKCLAVVTDSGGVLEEAAALGKVTFVVRYETERPELVWPAGTAMIGDEDLLREWIEPLLAGPPRYVGKGFRATAYGDGRSATRIVDVLEKCCVPFPKGGRLG